MWEYAGACSITFLAVFLCVGGMFLLAHLVGSNSGQEQ